MRDLDGYLDRRDGLEQVCSGLAWPFAIVAATPEPEIEGWIVSGFVPRNDDEQHRIEQLRRELSFDPALHSHRLTSHPNDAPTDAKRVLLRLCNDDPEREHACLVREILHQRGANNCARVFLDDVDHRVSPVFSDRG